MDYGGAGDRTACPLVEGATVAHSQHSKVLTSQCHRDHMCPHILCVCLIRDIPIWRGLAQQIQVLTQVQIKYLQLDEKNKKKQWPVPRGEAVSDTTE